MQSCQPDNNYSEPITITRDTVWFDTVFTQMGSSTQVFKIKNNTNQTIVLDRVHIPSGNNSNFRFNINGVVGPDVHDMELEGGDSVFVFVEVTVDPNGGTTPLIIEDSIVVEYQNTSQRTILVAFGQDAIYYFPTDTIQSLGLPVSELPCNTVWGPTKPIVLVGYVLVDPGCKLTILPGTQVHLYTNGALFVQENGTLQVLGDLNNPVVFQGTRLGYDYKDVPGQWERITIQQGHTDHIIRNAVIKNGVLGLQLDDFKSRTGDYSAADNVVLENVRIENMSAIGLYSINFNIQGYNVLVNNCGQYGVTISNGGNVRFYHSTFANYWSGSIRNFPTLFINNFFYDGTTTYNTNLNFEFYNGIVYGSTDNEVGYDSLITAGITYKFKFDHSLLRLGNTVNTNDASRYISLTKNLDPEFMNTYEGDYTLKAVSPAINKGDAAIVTSLSDKLLFDLKGSNRLVSGLPDAGAFEK